MESAGKGSSHSIRRVDSERHEMLEAFVYMYLIPLVCVPGVLTAALSTLTFARMRRSSLDVLLCGLSLFDVLLLSCSLVIYPPMAACNAIRTEHPATAYLTTTCKFFWRCTLVFYPLSLIAQVGSVWMCVAVTVDRFLAVSFPMRRLAACTTSKAAVAIAVIFIFSIMYKAPSALEITLTDRGEIMPTPLREQPIYRAIFHLYGYAAVMLVMPLLTIVSLNIIIIQKIRRAYGQQRLLTNNSFRAARREEAERKMTVMAVLVATLFMLTSLPCFMNNLVDEMGYSSIYRIRISLSNLLVCINSASNMLIYTVFNRRFRMFVLEILPWVKKKNRRSSISLDKKTHCTDLHHRTVKRRSFESFTSFAQQQIEEGEDYSALPPPTLHHTKPL